MDDLMSVSIPHKAFKTNAYYYNFLANNHKIRYGLRIQSLSMVIIDFILSELLNFHISIKDKL